MVFQKKTNGSNEHVLFSWGKPMILMKRYGFPGKNDSNENMWFSSGKPMILMKIFCFP